MDRYKLFEENRYFPYFILHKYFASLRFNEDAQQVANIALWKACRTFNSEKGFKFSTYAHSVIRNDILLYLRANKKREKLHCVSMDVPVFEDLNIADIIVDKKSQEFEDEIALADVIKSLRLTVKEKEVLQVYAKYQNQAIVGNHLSISQAQVSRVLKRVRKKMHSEIYKEVK